MSNVDVTRDASRAPLPPIDESVRIPESVRRAAERANSYYTAAPAPEAPVEAPEAPAEEIPAEAAPVAPETPPEPPKLRKTRAARPAPAPAEAAPAATPEPAPADPAVSDTEWEHRYRSMKGRYDAQQQIIGQMQEQMTMMGEELTRTQAVLMQQPDLTQPRPATKLVTDKDVADYGNDLIDLTRRAALEAVQPKLTELEERNKTLTQTLAQTQQAGVIQTLDREIPNWREINRDLRFKNWLSLRNVYSGVVRKRELDAAYQAADAARVLAFFKGFISDEAIATGDDVPAPLTEQPPAPRRAAVPLENLTAPGRARPAGGDTPTPADKPIFTRAQITRFYSDVRRGMYAGRDKEKNQYEQAIFAAQNEGRVR